MSGARLTPEVSVSDHRAGPARAAVTLVEFADFECPYSGVAYLVVKSIQKRLGDRLQLVFRHFPLTDLHPHAEHAAEVVEAAAEQGEFWEMHDMLFEHQTALGDRALISYAEALGLDANRVAQELKLRAYAPELREDFRSGVRSGVNSTPTFFINGERYDGIWSDEDVFLDAIGRAARRASSPRSPV